MMGGRSRCSGRRSARTSLRSGVAQSCRASEEGLAAPAVAGSRAVLPRYQRASTFEHLELLFRPTCTPRANHDAIVYRSSSRACRSLLWPTAAAVPVECQPMLGVCASATRRADVPGGQDAIDGRGHYRRGGAGGPNFGGGNLRSASTLIVRPARAGQGRDQGCRRSRPIAGEALKNHRIGDRGMSSRRCGPAL